MKRQVILGIFFCLLCGACVSSPQRPYFYQCDSVEKLDANIYMQSQEYDPDEPYIYSLSLTTLGDCVDVAVSWIGNMDHIDLEIMGKKVEFKYTVETEIPGLSWQQYGWVNLTDNEIREITENLIKEQSLKIKVNDYYEKLFPSSLCIYDKPYPYLQGSFYKSLIIKYKYGEQRPEYMRR